MRRIPVWILGALTILAAFLMWVGIDERREVGPVPIVLASIWILFILGSGPKIFKRDDPH